MVAKYRMKRNACLQEGEIGFGEFGIHLCQIAIGVDVVTSKDHNIHRTLLVNGSHLFAIGNLRSVPATGVCRHQDVGRCFGLRAWVGLDLR